MAVRRIDCECSSALHVRQGVETKPEMLGDQCAACLSFLIQHSVHHSMTQYNIQHRYKKTSVGIGGVRLSRVCLRFRTNQSFEPPRYSLCLSVCISFCALHLTFLEMTGACVEGG